jgi:hypothetical protein
MSETPAEIIARMTQEETNLLAQKARLSIQMEGLTDRLKVVSAFLEGAAHGKQIVPE